MLNGRWRAARARVAAACGCTTYHDAHWPAPMGATCTPALTMKILVDLKPALDGYAGIPQETRLLFRALKTLPGVQVDGLIQHGGRMIKAGLTARDEALPRHTRINKLSKFVISFHEKPYESWLQRVAGSLEARYAMSTLTARTAFNSPLPLTTFDPTLFPDFVWRTLFDKTLPSSARESVANSTFRVLPNSRHQFHEIGLLAPSDTKAAKYPVIDTTGYDFFIAQTPFPGRVLAPTKMIVRYHDAVPILFPHTVSDKSKHQATHFRSLQSNVADGAVFSCISEATKADLVTLYPDLENRVRVIHNIVSDIYTKPAEAVPRPVIKSVLANRGIDPSVLGLRAKPKPFDASKPFLLMVSTIEPRKNHLLLVRLWESLVYTSHPDLNLVVVGATGWDQGPVMSAFRPWAEQGRLAHLVGVHADELRMLYANAALTVCPSFAEGFDYSGVEALKCGGRIVASDIAVHREVYGSECSYFDPYSVDDAVEVTRAALEAPQPEVAVPGEVGFRYGIEKILPKWQLLLNDLIA